jgi:hypothetical protein
MSEARRKSITIDGAAVAEIDIRASHLTILHGLLGVRLGTDDPYTLPGFERRAVKEWIVRTLGKGSPLTSWPADASPAVKALPARQIGAAVIARFPFLAEPWRAVANFAALGAPRAILTHRLMGIEAEALTMAMGTLREAGILALPVHDALIVPASAVVEAEMALTEAYQAKAGIVPVVARKD